MADLWTKGTKAQLVAVGPQHVVVVREDGTKEELFIPGGVKRFVADLLSFQHLLKPEHRAA